MTSAAPTTPTAPPSQIAAAGTALAVVAPPLQSVALAAEAPAAIASRAMQVAEQLKSILAGGDLTIEIKGNGPDAVARKYVRIEGWQAILAMLGISTVVDWTRPVSDDEGIRFGWEGRVTLRDREGHDLGSGEAMVARDENVWRNRSEYALRSMVQCVPARAEILTRKGFRRFEQLAEDDDVLGYSTEDDRCAWVPLEAVNVFSAAPLVRMQSRSLDVLCTPNHSWAVRRTRGAARVPYQTLVETSALLGSDLIVVAAEAEAGDSEITPREAAILGWLITDGSFRYEREYRLRGHIDQSNPKYLDEIRVLVGDDATSERITTPDPAHRAPNGQPWGIRDSHRFSLSMPFMRSLFARAAVTTKADFPALATRLSAQARAAMWTAMLHADGSEFRDGLWRFGKRDPHTIETFQVLAALQGIALGKQHAREDVVMHATRRHRVLRAMFIKQTDADPEPVWCPTTPLGTWVMRLDGNVTITGNTRAQGKACRAQFGWIMSMAGYAATPAEELDGAGEERTVPPPPQRREPNPNLTAAARAPRARQEPATPAPEAAAPLPPAPRSVKQYIAFARAKYGYDETTVFKLHNAADIKALAEKGLPALMEEVQAYYDANRPGGTPVAAPATPATPGADAAIVSGTALPAAVPPVEAVVQDGQYRDAEDAGGIAFDAELPPPSDE